MSNGASLDSSHEQLQESSGIGYSENPQLSMAGTHHPRSTYTQRYISLKRTLRRMGRVIAQKEREKKKMLRNRKNRHNGSTGHIIPHLNTGKAKNPEASGRITGRQGRRHLACSHTIICETLEGGYRASNCLKTGIGVIYVPIILDMTAMKDVD